MIAAIETASFFDEERGEKDLPVGRQVQWRAGLVLEEAKIPLLLIETARLANKIKSTEKSMLFILSLYFFPLNPGQVL